MSRKRRRNKRKRKSALKGVGIGAHHEVSPMGHATCTKNKRDRLDQIDRKRKQQGWDG